MEILAMSCDFSKCQFSLYWTICYTLAVRGNKDLSRQLAEEKRRTKTRCSHPETARNAKKTP